MVMIERIRQLADKSGGLKSFARQLGIRHQSLYSWRAIPPGRVLDIERITGISRHELRPDIYGPRPTAEAEQ